MFQSKISHREPLITVAESSSAGNSLTAYPESLQQLIRKLQVNANLTPEGVTAMVREAAISVQDLMPWSDFTHSSHDSYGRKLVFYGGHFEIMVMSWLPDDFSAIHDHGSTQWGAVQCFGAAEHYIYQLTNQVLHSSMAAHYSPGMVKTVDHSLIHQMGNAGDQPFLSLHVYGCEENKDSITGDARVFDLLENSIQHTDGGVFFCLPEDKINRRIYGLRGDRATTLRQYFLMGDRIRRALNEQCSTSLVKKLTHLQTKLKSFPA